jgi:hypothetical protein
MKKGQKLIANDGYEVMLFPLPYMNISQGENGSYSHRGTYNIDFLGWNKLGREYKAPMYAPCTCKCVAKIDSYNKGRIFQSLNKVHTPNGLQYVTFMNFHDNNPLANVGDKFIQGQTYAHTGTAGIGTGDHTHFNCANGKYKGWEQVPPDNHGQLKNSTHIYDICYVNDTKIIDGKKYPWKEWKEVPPTPVYTIEAGRFPWVLYAKKFRDRINK